ncbi:hypothetical protein Taro_056866, partial [Colocasia esculenta]|nr:hypothetical protein [Colocasia esculenta]
MWLLGVSRGDTWLFLPVLVEVWDVGACVVRLWSHVVAPVFRELIVSAGVVFDPTLVVGHGITLFHCLVALCSRLNSNRSGSSDPWVAARPSGSLAGGSGRLLKSTLALPKIRRVRRK